MVLDRLKEGTAARHARLEERVGIDARLRDATRYADLLARFYGFYQPLEVALAGADGYAAVDLDLAARRKAAHLAADLRALGRDPADLPLAPAPPVRSPAEALGRLYVVEGATLGGRVVSRLVRDRLGLTPDRGCRFFSSYGDRVGAMWAAFRGAVARFADTPERADAVVAAACDTFDRLDDWLAAGGAP